MSALASGFAATAGFASGLLFGGALAAACCARRRMHDGDRSGGPR